MTQNNLNTYYQNEQQKFSIAALRKTFNSMVDAQIWQNKLNAIDAFKQSKQLDWNDNWFNRGAGVLGDALRGAVGDILSGSYKVK